MVGKVVYLNHYEVNLETAIAAFRGKEHWCVVGEDWWTMAEYSFSDMLEVKCPVHELPQVDLMAILNTVRKTPGEILDAFKIALVEAA